MKKTIFIILIILLIFTIAFIIRIIVPEGKSTDDQISVSASDQEPLKNFNVNQLSFSEWNSPDGLPYTQVPGANLGVTAFQLINEEEIAFLCNSTSEIIITKKSTGKLIRKWPVSFAPRDFIFEDNFYYVLSEYEVTVYDDKGREIRKLPFPSTVQGVERLSRYNDATWLLLPSGNSLLIENYGKPVTPSEYPGTITGTGLFITTKITGYNSFSVKIESSKDKFPEKSFTTDKKVAGVFVTGATENRLVLDVQTYISENPIAVERSVTSVGLDKNGTGNIICSKKVPTGNYVISNRDFYVGPNGNIYNMMTSPLGVYVFSLSETEAGKARDYPSSLTESTFQSNEHLIKQD